MSVTRLFIIGWLFLMTPRLTARAYYALSPAVERAYHQIMALETGRGLATLKSIKEKEPDNLAVHHLASYVDFFRIFLTEDEAYLEATESDYEDRLAALERLPESSPWRNYALAEVRLHRALSQLRFEAYLPAFRDVNRAHKLLRANAENFPNFLPTYKDLGLLHAAVGSIPPQFKWGVELLSSLRGNVEEGRREMERFLTEKDHLFYAEGAVLYALLRLHLMNQPEEAWQRLQRLELTPATNKLHCFLKANLAMRSGRNDLAIRTLEAQPRAGSADDFPYLDFMLGLAKIRSLDPTARLYFQSFLLRFRGHHYGKEAVQKIAWAELLRGRPDAYRQRMAEVNDRGRTTAGGDVNAEREAAAARLPHLGLLSARLLFDGGYYARARARLDAIDAATLDTDDLRLEYHYRTGRILHGLKDYSGALSFYERAIDLGGDHPAHFACSAALQAGLIEEKRGHDDAARRYFERCLALSPKEYRLGLHIQAKAGLNRL